MSPLIIHYASTWWAMMPKEDRIVLHMKMKESSAVPVDTISGVTPGHWTSENWKWYFEIFLLHENR